MRALMSPPTHPPAATFGVHGYPSCHSAQLVLTRRVGRSPEGGDAPRPTLRATLPEEVAHHRERPLPLQGPRDNWTA